MTTLDAARHVGLRRRRRLREGASCVLPPPPQWRCSRCRSSSCWPWSAPSPLRASMSWFLTLLGPAGIGIDALMGQPPSAFADTIAVNVARRPESLRTNGAGLAASSIDRSLARRCTRQATQTLMSSSAPSRRWVPSFAPAPRHRPGPDCGTEQLPSLFKVVKGWHAHIPREGDRDDRAASTGRPITLRNGACPICRFDGPGRQTPSHARCHQSVKPKPSSRRT